ncbi:hypothetical protein, partial [Azonexus sp. R2A61]|uniref:hypothetical protein n=1 Tax=Azonexus sp. R2A61 TaxID=2744443 RepID=UPI001F2AC63D
SVVLTFKDQFHRAVAFTPSAAEKRDYETQPQLRQAPQQNFFHLTACLASPKTPAPQGRCAFYTPQKNRQPHSANIPATQF